MAMFDALCESDEAIRRYTVGVEWSDDERRWIDDLLERLAEFQHYISWLSCRRFEQLGEQEWRARYGIGTEHWREHWAETRAERQQEAEAEAQEWAKERESS